MEDERMACFANRHTFMWGASTASDALPLSLSCECGAVSREHIIPMQQLQADNERLSKALQLWEEFDFERDNPKRLVETILALMVERDNAQALAGSLSEELHRVGKEIEELRDALAARSSDSGEAALRAALIGLKRAIEHAVEGKAVPDLGQALAAARAALSGEPVDGAGER